MITLSVICIGLLTMATASGTNIASFIIWRLLTGLALGACLPNVTALAAIWAPPGRRASTLTIVSLGISFGAPDGAQRPVISAISPTGLAAEVLGLRLGLVLVSVTMFTH